MKDDTVLSLRHATVNMDLYDSLEHALADLPAWLADGSNVAELSALIETVYRLSPLLADRVAAMFIATAEMEKPRDQAQSPDRRRRPDRTHGG